jgi:adenylyl- and sulfurtransferase ThiI
LVIAAFVVVGLVGGPVASQTLGIVSLPAWAWAVSIILPLSVIPFVELVKWLHRINTKKHNQLFAATK